MHLNNRPFKLFLDTLVDANQYANNMTSHVDVVVDSMGRIAIHAQVMTL